ncbi:MAG: hypothetical protein LRY27_00010 [Chitinophagales bacterium]|nr:hypothetical protein [Chitinophagales bacterium]
MGHIIPAKLLGYTTHLHFVSMDWFVLGNENYKASTLHQIWVISSGVFTTLLIGTIGFFYCAKM